MDLSDVNTPDVWADPGYYKFNAEHSQSYSVKLRDKDSKPLTDELPKIEKISIAKNDQPNSLDLNRPKLADYKESKQKIILYTLGRSSTTFL